MHFPFYIKYIIEAILFADSARELIFANFFTKRKSTEKVHFPGMVFTTVYPETDVQLHIIPSSSLNLSSSKMLYSFQSFVVYKINLPH